ALDMRRRAEDLRDGDDAGSTNASDDDPEGAVDRRKLRLRQRRQFAGLGRHPRAALQLGAVHGHEGRAEAFDAAKILVAARLRDLALAPEFGLQRLHRHTVRLYAAIAAALADELVDDHALVGIREFAALAATALLGGAGLVINQRRDAWRRRELP